MHKSSSPRRFALAALLAGVAAATAVGAAFRADMKTAHARLEGRSRVVQSPYGPIEYAVLGAGPPVLVIHGTGGGFDQGLAMTAPLAPHGYQLIAPSRFGYLRSGWPTNASPEVQADALAWLLEHLGYRDVAVLGGSAGALSAMQLAIRHPEKCRALILLVPASYAPDRAPNTSGAQGPIARFAMQAMLKSDFLFWATLKLAPDQMTRLLLATEPDVVRAAGRGETARVDEVRNAILPVSARQRGILSDAIAGTPPPYPLDRIACPVLAISARDDLFGTYPAAAYAARRVPKGELLGFETGGHILAGRDRDVWSGVAAFLGRSPDGGSGKIRKDNSQLSARSPAP